MTILIYLAASNDSLSEESACLKLPVKKIYSATNNLCASNFIGQGIAGEKLSLLVYLGLFFIHDKLLKM